MAAMTGFGMLSQSAMALSKNPPPLPARISQGLCEADKHSDGEMTNKIAGRAAGQDDNANVGVARESLQRLGERVAHLRVEEDALCAPQCNDRYSIGYSCRQNIGVHRVLLPRPDFSVRRCRFFRTGNVLNCFLKIAKLILVGD
jgi:hypothetical protein